MVLSETQSNVPSFVTNTTNTSAYNAIGLSCQGGTTQCGGLNVPSGGATFPLNVTSIPNKTVYGYTQQWSLSVQREVMKSTIAQLAYVGTRGIHLTAVRDLNQLQPLSSGLNPFSVGQPITSSVCNSGATYNIFSTAGSNSSGSTTITSSAGIGPTSPGYVNMMVACAGNPGFYKSSSGSGTVLGVGADSVRPYPGFSNIISVDNIADSKYHALQATLRTVTKPLTIGVAYTYSHSLDDASDRASANFADSSNLKSNYASSDFDQRHMLNISYIYDLPFLNLLHGFAQLAGPGPEDEANAEDEKRMGAAPSRAVKSILGNWQVSGITTWQTGTPFSVINGGGADGTGTADNGGVGNGLGIGSYVDLIGSARGQKPIVTSSSANVGPLLYNPGRLCRAARPHLRQLRTQFAEQSFPRELQRIAAEALQGLQGAGGLRFRAEGYNIFNHTQFRIYDPSHPGSTGNNIANCYGDITTQYSAGASGCLTGNSFLHPVDAHDPRILQFGLKGSF